MNKIFKIYSLIIFGIFLLLSTAVATEEKIKIGLLVPITGDNKKLGQQIVKSVQMALKDIDTDKIEIHLKDTNSNPDTATK